MPQLDQIAQIYASQLFWLVLVFALLYFGIGKAMLPKIQSTVDDREAKIAADLAAAASARAAADTAEADWTAKLDQSRAAAQAELNAAIAKATAATEARLKAADVELHDRSHRADAALAHAREKAFAEIEVVAIDAAQDIVQRLTGQQVERGAVATAVVSAMARG